MISPTKHPTTLRRACLARLALFVSMIVAGEGWTGTPAQGQNPGGPVARLAVVDAVGNSISITRENRIMAWGKNGEAVELPAGLSGIRAVAGGFFYSLALKHDGTVVAWGDDFSGQCDVPAGLGAVVAIAAGDYHSVALKSDGTVAAWGDNNYGQTQVPKGLHGVIAIAAGGAFTLALKSDGTVVAWGAENDQYGNIANYGQTQVPAHLAGVVAIAAGEYHSLALKSNGTVVAWGLNYFGQTSVPARLTHVTGIGAGSDHSVALMNDGTVVAWGGDALGQTDVPAGLTGGVALSASFFHNAVLKRDGTVAAWGTILDEKAFYQQTVPAGLDGIIAVAADAYQTLVIADAAGSFEVGGLGQSRDHTIFLNNPGAQPLTSLSATIEGPDAEAFSITTPLPGGIAVNAARPLTLRFRPLRMGLMSATLKIFSNDPASPFVLPLTGGITLATVATRTGVANSAFTYGPLTPDPLTGQMLQKVSFTNTSTAPLNGLRLILSKVAAGITVHGSSLGDKPGTLDVLYTNPIAAGATVSFNLVFFDPLRRTASSINTVITAEALEDPVPQPGEVKDALIQLLGVSDSPEGPLLQWNTVRNGVYVVEYSDDKGATWHSAVHRLGGNSGRMFWVDRGQPETQTTPLNKAARMYRVKKV